MTNQFYRAFEDRYRGSRDLIKQRLYAYRPFLQALHARYPGAGALDLGCGRGEWLEVLGEQGFAGRGVDLDAGMLAACVERGLDVAEQDALAALAALPDASVAVVSAFHLVEHIPFDMVRSLVSEALRVLLPGGLLIMETPNPENMVVGSCDFYTDPSHLRPIPPNLLAFAAEHGGFARHAILRLQEDARLHEDLPLNLLSVLEGPSPDYSVLAQKNAGAEVLAGFDALFAADYGITMKALALRYESQAAARHAEIHRALGGLADRISADRASTAAEHQLASQASQAAVQLATRLDGELGAATRALDGAMARLGQLESELRGGVDARLCRLEREAEQLQQFKLEHWRADIEARQARSEQLVVEQAQRIADLLQSRSWRITAPLRWFGIRARVLREIAREAQAQGNSGSAAVARRVSESLMRRVNLARSLMAPIPAQPAQPEPAPPAAPPATEIALAPRAARIYRELKQAHEARKDRCE
ncbi:class I SAM-dependent methyltransferase [Massilia sp. GCM10023247]|uniref:class I SAM-dependent methyltransferase n=1 Tax=Massilia sp. GCM10023247 TaxID=3252643 RepID=UPI00361FA55D